MAGEGSKKKKGAAKSAAHSVIKPKDKKSPDKKSPDKKTKSGELYHLPRKVAHKSDRLKRTELKGVSLGIQKDNSFELNCEALRNSITTTGQLDGNIAWTPAEAHFHMGQFFWNLAKGKDQAAQAGCHPTQGVIRVGVEGGV